MLSGVAMLAQSPAFSVAFGLGGIEDDEINAVAGDAAGNLLIAGSFRNTVTTGATTHTSFGATDAFVAKLDASGQLVWFRQAGGANLDTGNAVAVDAGGNVYLGGSFDGSFTLGGVTLQTRGGEDGFIAKFNSGGDLLWLRQAGGDGGDAVRSLALDSAGAVLFTGYSFSNDYGQTASLTVRGFPFVGKLDGAGNQVWAGPPNLQNFLQGNSTGFGIAVDAGGNAWVTGVRLTSTSTPEAIIGKVDAGGTQLWYKYYAGGASGNVYGRGIAVDPVRNVAYATGLFTGQNGVFFGPVKLTPAGSFDGYITKMDDSGNVLWARQWGGSGFDAVNALDLDADGNPVPAGYFNGTATFGALSLTTFGVQKNACVAKLDAAGNFLWAKRGGGESLSEARGVRVTPAGNVVLAGTFFSTAAFDAKSLNSVGGEDGFVAVLNTALPPIIGTPPASQSAVEGSSVTFTVTATGTPPLLYQWRKDGVAIPGATASSHSIPQIQPAHAGAYTVAITNSVTNVISQPAILTVTPPPTPPAITQQPQSQTVTVGGAVTFAVTATGNPPPTFQWRKEATNIVGATASSYSIPLVQTQHAGAYTVVVGNSVSNLVSEVATLTVTTPPQAAGSNTVELRVEGPGVARFDRPRPHLPGEMLGLLASPLAGTRFAGWGDGNTNAMRTITVPPSNSVFMARFEELAFASVPDFTNRELTPLDPTNRPSLGFSPAAGGRFQLRVQLPGRHGFKLLAATNLAQNSFTPVPFALTSNAPIVELEGVGDPGPLDLYVAPPAGTNRQAFYLLGLDNGFTVPVLLFADADLAAPGAQLTLFGRNFTNAAGLRVKTETGQTLGSSTLDSNRVTAVVPSTPGDYRLRVEINGAQVAGVVPVTVVGTSNAPAVNAPASIPALEDGILRLTGTNFGTNASVWMDGGLLRVLHQSADGTELYVRLPRGVSSGVLSVVADGVRSLGRTLNLTTIPYTAYVNPLSVFVFEQGAVTIPYTAYVNPVSVYVFTPGAVTIPYTAYVFPIRVQVP